MKRMIESAPKALIGAAAVALLLRGPIPQPSNYHDFADQRFLLGFANGPDVLSNLGFAIVGLWGLYRLWPARHLPPVARGWDGYALFLASLLLTAVGSGFYHLDPDNGRLVWDRMPIALGCAGLLSGALAENRPNVDGRRTTFLLALAAPVGYLRARAAGGA